MKTTSSRNSQNFSNRIRRALAPRAVVFAALMLTYMVAQAQTTVPSTFVLPSSAGDASKPGFVWRIHQVPTYVRPYNSRAEDELAGLLGNNIADPNAQGVALASAAPANPATVPIYFEIPSVIN